MLHVNTVQRNGMRLSTNPTISLKPINSLKSHLPGHKFFDFQNIADLEVGRSVYFEAIFESKVIRIYIPVPQKYIYPHGMSYP